jgi:poly-gamma-glutamate synthesis protein (capsule biosynthesis protein)
MMNVNVGRVLFVACSWMLVSSTTARAARLLFVGDVLLSRQVAQEMDARPAVGPWAHLGELFAKADWVMGNLEGAVGAAADCLPQPRGAREAPCFAIDAARLGVLRAAGIRALTVENNHAGDLGDRGRTATAQTLRAARLQPLDFEDSPAFTRTGDDVIAFVVVNHVAGRDGKRTAPFDPVLRRKLRLARHLANWVVVSVHWGSELMPFPQEEQRREAAWLVESGADLIVGHHPHVVQPAECVRGRPVFYSLGNHLFDQRIADTRRGLMADCTIERDLLRCGGMTTAAQPRSTFVALKGREAAVDEALAHCPVTRRPPTAVGEVVLQPVIAANAVVDGDLALEGSSGGRVLFRTVRQRLLSLESGALTPGGPPLLVLLERHVSDMDGEAAPRPYVYSVLPTGLQARWRGSSLAYPLIDATLLPDGRGANLLCGLHRGDAFVTLDPANRELRTFLYRWNGFGFSAGGTADAVRRCAHHYGAP